MQKGFTGNALKLIAIAAMTLDHVLWVVFPGYQIEWWLIALHTVGRITAPIMWFFIVEGYLHTHDFRKYAGRLFLFALSRISRTALRSGSRFCRSQRASSSIRRA